MAYYPRKRSETLVPKIYNWPQVNLGKAALLSFAAYKAGMAHVVMIDDRQTSPFYGKEIVRPVTVLDAPPPCAWWGLGAIQWIPSRCSP